MSRYTGFADGLAAEEQEEAIARDEARRAENEAGAEMARLSISPPIMAGSNPDAATATTEPATSMPMVPAMGSGSSLRQGAFGTRAGSGASQTGALSRSAPSRLGASGGNGLATSQGAFGSRAGTGASQTGMLANARSSMAGVAPPSFKR